MASLIPVFALVLISIVAMGGLLVFMTVVVRIIKAVAGRQDSVTLSREESEQLRRMWESLDRMEERIANLETILLHREKEEPYEKLG